MITRPGDASLLNRRKRVEGLNELAYVDLIDRLLFRIIGLGDSYIVAPSCAVFLNSYHGQSREKSEASVVMYSFCVIPLGNSTSCLEKRFSVSSMTGQTSSFRLRQSVGLS